jgi:hypothetical protein
MARNRRAIHVSCRNAFASCLRSSCSVPGEWVSEEHASELEELLPRHPKAEQKIGVVIDHLEVRSAEGGTQCFWVILTDATGEQFSYIQCVDSELHYSSRARSCMGARKALGASR